MVDSPLSRALCVPTVVHSALALELLEVVVERAAGSLCEACAEALIDDADKVLDADGRGLSAKHLEYLLLPELAVLDVFTNELHRILNNGAVP